MMSERPSMMSERPYLRSERPDLRPGRPDLRPERLDLKPGGEMNAQTNEQMSPCVLQEFVPFRAAAQKRGTGKLQTWVESNE